MSRQRTFTGEEIVNGIAENNEHILQQIYLQNYTAVKNFVITNSGDETDAQDVFQDAIIAIWLNVKEGKFKLLNGATIDGYLFQVARNKWLDKVRSAPFKKTMRLVNDEFDVSNHEEALNAENKDNRIAYMQSLYANLGEKCKAILNRFYFEKKSLAEIGDELNYDAETLRTTKYRCMMKLRKMHQENKEHSI
jgi:RNA polymerase sigma factor (sigma-70 family)